MKHIYYNNGAKKPGQEVLTEQNSHQQHGVWPEFKPETLHKLCLPFLRRHVKGTPIERSIPWGVHKLHICLWEGVKQAERRRVHLHILQRDGGEAAVVSGKVTDGAWVQVSQDAQGVGKKERKELWVLQHFGVEALWVYGKH